VCGLSNALPAPPVRCLASERTGRLPRSGHGRGSKQERASTPSSGLPAVARHDVAELGRRHVRHRDRPEPRVAHRRGARRGRGAARRVSGGGRSPAATAVALDTNRVRSGVLAASGAVTALRAARPAEVRTAAARRAAAMASTGRYRVDRCFVTASVTSARDSRTRRRAVRRDAAASGGAAGRGRRGAAAGRGRTGGSGGRADDGRRRAHGVRRADGRWRWRYRDPANDVELDSNTSYLTEQLAEADARQAYPETPLVRSR
jgi:hypothetical protein